MFPVLRAPIWQGRRSHFWKSRPRHPPPHPLTITLIHSPSSSLAPQECVSARRFRAPSAATNHQIFIPQVTFFTSHAVNSGDPAKGHLTILDIPKRSRILAEKTAIACLDGAIPLRTPRPAPYHIPLTPYPPPSSSAAPRHCLAQVPCGACMACPPPPEKKGYLPGDRPGLHLETGGQRWQPSTLQVLTVMGKISCGGRWRRQCIGRQRAEAAPASRGTTVPLSDTPEFHLTTERQGGGVPDPPFPLPPRTPPLPRIKWLDQIFLPAFCAIFHCVVGAADCMLHVPLFPVLFLSVCWASYCLFAFTALRKRHGTPSAPHCATPCGGRWFSGECVSGLPKIALQNSRTTAPPFKWTSAPLPPWFFRVTSPMFAPSYLLVVTAGHTALFSDTNC